MRKYRMYTREETALTMHRLGLAARYSWALFVPDKLTCI
jgi:hypothetical protein